MCYFKPESLSACNSGSTVLGAVAVEMSKTRPLPSGGSETMGKQELTNHSQEGSHVLRASVSTRDWGLEELGEIMESFMVGVSPS